MNITKEKLKSLLNNVKENNRFTILTNLFDKIASPSHKVTYNQTYKEVSINSVVIRYEDNEGTNNPTIEYFGPAKDKMSVDSAYSGVKVMASKFKGNESLVEQIGSMLGGFDFETHKMIDKYRIISNTIKGKDDYRGTLTSVGQSRHPSSHFADNNYFFNIMYFIQQPKNTSQNNSFFENSTMVLRYPGNYFKVTNDDNNNSTEYKKQKEVLACRFPPKFLWMWANKDTVIHPYSLMAFRNFLNSEYGTKMLLEIDKSYTPEYITNMEIKNFPKIWKKISDKILEEIVSDYNSKNDDEKREAISQLSKLISNIMTQETDIKNISDLLSTGNKAVILWGPPGTGKTYESMEIVKELLVIPNYYSEEMIERIYNFSNQKTSVTNISGRYEIIQFHPNYTYEDFIGGISPKIDGSNVSYELREGVFYKFCKKANNNPNQKYIFIIDEINRAELSAVFGELLFALEYRGKHINLPHFGSFTIPENVYILGTMNNVDKSLVTFDLALRRRFGFFKLMPKLDVIIDVLGDKVEEESLNNYVNKCKQLNILISKSTNSLDENEKIIMNNIKDYSKLFLELGEDYQIGQAYFLKIKDFLKDENDAKISSFDLERLWVYNIEPLLEEYLGMSIEDEEIQNKLSTLKVFFEN